MTFEARSRQQAQSLVDTLTAQAVETVKTGLDALVRDLTAVAKAEVDAARTEVETAAARALIKSQEVADATLASLKAEAQQKIAAEQRENVSLRTSVEQMRTDLQVARTSAQAEIAQARAELEARIEQVQTARTELARVLAETQRDAAGAHAEAEATALKLKDAQARISSLETERAGLVSARDQATAETEAERQRVRGLTDALAASRQETVLVRQEARLAMADAEGRRQALEAALEQVRALEAAEASRAAAVPVEPVVVPVAVSTGEPDVALMETVGAALRLIDAATSATDVLGALIEQLGQHFDKAAVFLVGPASFKGWRTSEAGSSSDIGNIEIPRTIDSALTRALTKRRAWTVTSVSGQSVTGVFGTPASAAMAVPVFANGRAIAVAYAEHAGEVSPTALAIGQTMAEVLIDHANRRLAVKRRTEPTKAASSGSAPRFGQPAGASVPVAASGHSRQARRLAMASGLTVTLEGNPTLVIDMSLLGAQVVSPVTLRPKRIVRLTLPSDAGTVVCRGRVVWAQYEQPTGTTGARYRAGLRFTDADPKVIEGFILRHTTEENRDLSSRLEDTA